MKREEFIRKLEEMGFELWSKDEEKEVWGRTTYEGGVTSIGTPAEDWEEWHIYENKAVHLYGTNREVPGWTMCPYCGNWYQDNEEEYHKDCEPEVIYFRR